MTLDEQLAKYEQFLTYLSGGEDKVGTMKGRIAVAASCGYLDARFMVYLKETFGFPLSMSALEAAKRGLKIDFGGLAWELEKIGKKKSTIESEIKEVRFFAARGDET